jgi:putative holliday junction resolvase
LDVSERRIGVAAVDGPGGLPRALFTYARVSRARDLAQLLAWAGRFGTATLVLGLPLNMDGTEGPRAVWMRRFARHLGEATGLPVRLQDERLTTVEADEVVSGQWSVVSGGSARDAGNDAVAAALILERFMAESTHD